jgi:hypothetical protein
MLFCARLRHFIDLLSKHRHVRPSRMAKLLTLLSICLLLQRSIKREDDLYERAVRGIDIREDPLFIIGHWRSGTTYLHYLLGLDSAHVAYPTNYQCFFPTVFLTLDERSRTYQLVKRLMGKRTRLIDNMELSLTSPQEEEWMYLPEEGYSYIFEKLFFPETAVSDYDDILKLSTDQQSRDVTLRIFKKLTFAHQKRIVSKSPGHFSRIPLLQELFPKSQIVFLVRNPYDVIVSTMHTKKILTRILSLQRRNIPDDLMETSKFLIFYFEVVCQYLKKLDKSQYHVVKYEDFVRNPVESIKNIYHSFDISYTAEYHNQLSTYANSMKSYKRNEFAVTPQMKEMIYQECRPVFEAYGYAP